MVLLFVLSLANLTAEGAAQRGLAHSVAILVEIDAYLDDHYEAVRQQASASEASSIVLPDFPVPIAVAPQEVTAGDRESLRELLLERSGSAIYDEGVEVMREGRDSEASFFSTQGAIGTGMDFLRPTPHLVLNYMTISLAAVGALLAGGIALSARGYGRIAGLGVAVFVGSMPFLIFAIAARFALRVAADGVDDYVAREFLELAQELTWAPIRNGIIFSIGSGALLAAAVLLARWDDLGFAGPRH